MNNFNRGPLSLVGTGAKTGLAVSFTENTNQNNFNTIGTFLGPVKKVKESSTKFSMVKCNNEPSQ